MEAASKSPTVIYAALGVMVLLAAIGWWRAADRGNELAALRAAAAETEAGLNGKITELTDEVAALQQQIADAAAAGADLAALKEQIAAASAGINDRLAVLKEREQEVATIEATLSGRRADLAAAGGGLAAASRKLNARLRALGDREREEAEIGRRLTDLAARQAAAEAALASVQERIGARLEVLGARERTLADTDGAVSRAEYRLEQLGQEEAALTARLQAARAQLEQIDVEFNAKRRAAEDDWARVGKARQVLDDLRQLVSQR